MNDMSDHEKSVLLVEMQGWSIEHHADVDAQTGKEYWTSWVSDSTGTPIEWPCGESTIEWSVPAFKPGWREFKLDLYLPVNMSLAWRVVRWACTSGHQGYYTKFLWWDIYHLAQDDGAQRLLLDTILEMAIEAGIIEVSDD